MYVATHELAHRTLLEQLQVLLREAMKIGVYSYQDFAKDPEPYCGIQITSSVV